MNGEAAAAGVSSSSSTNGNEAAFQAGPLAKRRRLSEEFDSSFEQHELQVLDGKADSDVMDSEHADDSCNGKMKWKASIKKKLPVLLRWLMG